MRGTISNPSNVRVIAATNRDLEAAIDAGTFRRDLFYRLTFFPIEISSYAERKREDMTLLSNTFDHFFARKRGTFFRGHQSKRTLGSLLV